MLYRVTKEKAAVNQRKIVCPLENILLFIFVASKSTLFVEQFQIQHGQLREEHFKPPRISPHAKSKKEMRPQGLIQGFTLMQFCAIAYNSMLYITIRPYVSRTVQQHASVTIAAFLFTIF